MWDSQEYYFSGPGPQTEPRASKKCWCFKQGRQQGMRQRQGVGGPNLGPHYIVWIGWGGGPWALGPANAVSGPGIKYLLPYARPHDTKDNGAEHLTWDGISFSPHLDFFGGMKQKPPRPKVKTVGLLKWLFTRETLGENMTCHCLWIGQRDGLTHGWKTMKWAALNYMCALHKWHWRISKGISSFLTPLVFWTKKKKLFLNQVQKAAHCIFFNINKFCKTSWILKEQ